MGNRKTCQRKVDACWFSDIGSVTRNGNKDTEGEGRDGYSQGTGWNPSQYPAIVLGAALEFNYTNVEGDTENSNAALERATVESCVMQVWSASDDGTAASASFPCDQPVSVGPLAGGIVGFLAAPTPEPVTHTKFITEPAPPMPESCQSAFKKAEETFLEFEEFTVVVGDAVTATDGKNYLLGLYQDGITAQRTLISASIREYVEAKVLCEDETGLTLPTAPELEQYKR